MPRDLAALLVEEGAAPAEAVERAIAHQREAGGALDTALLEVGAISEKALLPLLARAAGVPAAPQGAWTTSDARARRVFPSRVAERHGLAPFALDGRELSLVATYPVDVELLDEISFMLSLHLTAHVGPEWRVRELIHRLYGTPLAARLASLAARSEATAEAGSPFAESAAPEGPPPAPPPTGFERDESEPLEPLAAALEQALDSFDFSDEPAPPPEVTRSETAVAAARTERVDRTAPPRWTLGQARAALAAARDRDEIVLAALRYTRDFFEYAALFAVTRDAIAGHDALGSEDARDRVRSVAIWAADAGMFKTVLETRSPYLGPVSEEVQANRTVLSGLGRSAPRTALVCPVILRDRPVCVMYADNGEAPVSAGRLGDLLLLLSTIGAAFERIIRDRKERPALEEPPAAAAEAAGGEGGLAGEPPATEPAGAPLAAEAASSAAGQAVGAPGGATESGGAGAQAEPYAPEIPATAETGEEAARPAELAAPEVTATEAGVGGVQPEPAAPEVTATEAEVGGVQPEPAAPEVTATEAEVGGVQPEPAAPEVTATEAEVGGVEPEPAPPDVTATEAGAGGGQPEPAASDGAATDAGAGGAEPEGARPELAAAVESGAAGPQPEAAAPELPSTAEAGVGGAPPGAAGPATEAIAEAAAPEPGPVPAAAEPAVTFEIVTGEWQLPATASGTGAEAAPAVAQDARPRTAASPSAREPVDARGSEEMGVTRTERPRPADGFAAGADDRTPDAIAAALAAIDVDVDLGEGFGAEGAPAPAASEQRATAPDEEHGTPEGDAAADRAAPPAWTGELSPASAWRRTPAAESLDDIERQFFGSAVAWENPAATPPAARAEERRGPAHEGWSWGDVQKQPGDANARSETEEPAAAREPTADRAPDEPRAAAIEPPEAPPRAREEPPPTVLPAEPARASGAAAPVAPAAPEEALPVPTAAGNQPQAPAPDRPETPVALADRALDADPAVAAAACEALSSRRRDPALRPASEKLRRALLSGIVSRATRAARALGALRDVEAIPLLVQALETSEAETAQAAADALASITLQRIGTDARKWLGWWKQNRGRGRAEWLFSGLTSADRETRVAADAELRQAGDAPVEYSPDMPAPERELAARAWAGWLARSGHVL